MARIAVPCLALLFTPPPPPAPLLPRYGDLSGLGVFSQRPWERSSHDDDDDGDSAGDDYDDDLAERRGLKSSSGVTVTADAILGFTTTAGAVILFEMCVRARIAAASAAIVADLAHGGLETPCDHARPSRRSRRRDAFVVVSVVATRRCAAPLPPLINAAPARHGDRPPPHPPPGIWRSLRSCC